MKHPRRLILSVCWLSVLLLFPACALDGLSTPTPSGIQLTAAQVKEDYAAYEGQLVSVRGYGVIMMTVPLCPGYVGMDTRLSFIDEENNQITAVVTATAAGAERDDSLREFRGYVRVFNGEIGCPGSLRTENFPYFEIVEIK